MTGGRLADIARQYWRREAACAGEDPRMWDLDAPGELQAAGEEICNTCKVRDDCLADAKRGNGYGTRRGNVALANNDFNKKYLLTCAWCTKVFLGKYGRKYCGKSCAGHGASKLPAVA